MSLKRLQETLGITADGLFGPTTFRHAKEHFELSDNRAVHFFAQVAHETGNFRAFSENLNYSAESMMRVWPSRFPDLASCEPYARNPKALADKVYSNRMGNGEGEGSLYIGRGFLQLTGKSNYRSFASDMELPEVITDPDLVSSNYAFETALWFFNKNNLFDIADKGVNEEIIKKITKRVNGGYHGLDDRIEQTNKIYEWLNA